MRGILIAALLIGSIGSIAASAKEPATAAQSLTTPQTDLDFRWTTGPDTVIWSSTVKAIQPHEMFRMGARACLRGPLVFQDIDGKPIFRLDDGVEYPVGCMHADVVPK